MPSTVITFPVPAWANAPIEPQFYSPNFFFISNVALGQTTLVTTTVNHNFVIGQLTRLIIPPTFGCIQLNEQEGYVISIPSPNQVELTIYSAGGTSFNSSSATTQPQILPVGEINTGAINSSGRLNTGTAIPGSFINISPA